MALQKSDIEEALKALADTVTKLSKVEHPAFSGAAAELDRALDSGDSETQLAALTKVSDLAKTSEEADTDLYAMMAVINDLQGKAAKKLLEAEAANRPKTAAPPSLEELMKTVQDLRKEVEAKK